MKQHALSDQALVLYGFSQGGMVATYAGIAREQPPAGLVCHSGQFWGAREIRSKPRMLLVVGELELAPGQSLSKVFRITRSELQRAGIEVHARECKGLGHGVNMEAIDLICSYIQASLQH